MANLFQDMTKRLSQNELDQFLRKESKGKTKDEIWQTVEKKRTAPFGRIPDKSIFLCHSHIDKTIISKVALLFKKVDVEIYIDWMDKAMPVVTDNITASTIRKKIEHCNRFLFLATAGSLTSKWCNWELGIAYSLKKESEIAILPIASKTKKWRGLEYLLLYPEMRINEMDLEQLDENHIDIHYPDNRVTSLTSWLS